MHKLLFFLSLAIFSSSNLSAQETVTVNVPTAGGFSAALSAAGGNKATVTNLTVAGNIDARDVKFMRDSMPVLAVLDMEEVQIKSYSGTEGTVTGSTSYPTNTMPQESFKSSKIVAGVQGNGTLKSIVLPAGLAVIGNSAFFQCQGLIGILTIPNSVTTIESYAFCTCYHLTGLVLSGSLETIGDNAFSTCYALTCSLKLPNSLKTIGIAAFDGCPFTGTLKIPNGISKISERAFQSCKFSGLILPNSILTIDYDAFGWCSNLTDDLIIPNSVKTISNGFRLCPLISACYIPSSVTTLSSNLYKQAFYGCKGLKKFVLNRVTPLIIDTSTFTGVNKTACELIVPMGSKASYQTAIGWKLFSNITEVIFVTIDTQGGNPAFPITTSVSNSTISEPIIPIREGYTFAGWYKETACTNAWNFATDIVTTPITLYAKWGIATSVEKLQPTNFKIYPNPATSALYVENLPCDAKINISSLDGKTVKQQKSVANDGNIDIRNLPKGVYLLKINSKAGSQVQRFVKQ